MKKKGRKTIALFIAVWGLAVAAAATVAAVVAAVVVGRRGWSVRQVAQEGNLQQQREKEDSDAKVGCTERSHQAYPDFGFQTSLV